MPEDKQLEECGSIQLREIDLMHEKQIMLINVLQMS